ncbi:hypothetical protein G6659_06125 [Polynucleobacter paneuropaeus]|nr:hypothetical protein G6659_06125 [Polynucleobacter paneuropaeus]
MDELLTNLSHNLTPRLRSIFVNNEYSFYDVVDLENFPSSQTYNLIKSSKHISFFNKKLKEIKKDCLIEIASISANKIDDDFELCITFRMDIAELFDGYEKDYLLPFYTHLHFESYFESNETFYRFTDDHKNLELRYHSLNGESLVKMTNQTKLKDFVKKLEQSNLIELLKS